MVQRLPAPAPSTYGLSRLRLDREASREQTRAAMHEWFEQIHALAAKGLSKEAIAKQLDPNRQTVGLTRFGRYPNAWGREIPEGCTDAEESRPLSARVSG